MKYSIYLLFIIFLSSTVSYCQFVQVYPQEFVSSISKMAFHDSGLGIAVLECDGILRSTDNGESWTYIEVPGMATQYQVIFIDNDPKKILISGSYAAFRSNDGGLTFEPVSYSGVKSAGLRRFITQLSNGKYLMICRTASSISDDLVTWKQLDGLGASNIVMKGNTFFTTGGRVVMKSADNAATYDTVHTFDQNILGLNYNENDLYISLLDGTVHLSVDSGQSFQTINTPPSGFSDLHVYDRNHLLFLSNNRASYTTDGGLNYTTTLYNENRISGFNNFAIRKDGKIFVNGESLKIITSADEGMTWKLENGRKEDFICIEANQNLVAVGGDEGNMAYSVDGGKSWKDVTFGEEGYITEIVPIGPNKIYCYEAGQMKGQLIDYNGKTQTSFIFSQPITSLDYYKNKLYAVQNGAEGIILVSVDEGITWTQLAKLDKTIIQLDFINDSEWIATTYEGLVFLSTDAGTTWNIIHNEGDIIISASFKNKNEGVYLSRTMLKGTNDGFTSTEETAKPYNAISLTRAGDKVYCLGANGSNTYMYELTGLVSNKGMKSGCVAHNVIATTTEGVVIAGRGRVIEFFESKSTNVNDQNLAKAEKIKISPNPADQVILIEGISELSDIVVYDALGRPCTINITREEIDISQLPAGVYTLSSSRNKRAVIGRFIKL